MAMSLLVSSFAWGSDPKILNRVTFTSLDEVTRVTIATGGKVQYRAIGRLQNPDRLYYDIFGPDLLTHGNVTQMLSVADQLLERIRICQKEGGILRVVLDLRKPVQVVASQIPNPDRFMIELRPAISATLPSLLATHSGQKLGPKIEAAGVQKLHQRLVENPRPVMATQRGIAAVQTGTKPTGQDSLVSVGFHTAKLRLAADSPRVQTIKDASQESRLPAQLAKQNRDNARPLNLALGLRVSPLAKEPEHGGGGTGPTSRSRLMAKQPVLDVARQPGNFIEQPSDSEIIRRSKNTFTPREALSNEKDAELKSQLSMSRQAVMQASQHDVSAAPRQARQGTARETITSMRSLVDKLRLVPDPPHAQVNKHTCQPSPLRTQRAQQNRDDTKSLIRALGLKVRRVVLDPGHGGDDTGASSPSGLMEKELVLDVAQRLGNLIEKHYNSEVIYTRSSDTFVPLEERSTLAKDNDADLFVSIHANWSPSRSAIGSETYYLNLSNTESSLDVAARENALSKKNIHELQDLIQRIALSEKVNESREFAAIVQSALHSSLSLDNGEEKSRGVKQAPFVVLVGSRVPSILVEIGFLSNPLEENQFKRSDHRQRIADALYKGVAQYMNRLSHIDIAQRD
jgi:N-acetylmuramoyl-L-alanine amidase